MNNIYDNFINNKSLDGIEPNNNDPISSSILKLSLALKNKHPFHDAILEANLVKAEHEDNNILAIFFITWAQLLWKENKIPDAYALINRCKTLWQDIDNEVKAQVHIIEGLLASKKGDKKTREQLGLEALDLLPISSDRRPNACLSYCYFMAQQGKGEVIKDHIKYLTKLPKEIISVSMIALIQFTDCISTGRIKESLKWHHIIEKDLKVLDVYSFAKKNYKTHIVMLKVMQGDWDIDASIDDADNAFHSARTIRALLARCPSMGLKLAKEYMSEYLLKENAFNGIGIESYNLLRAELSKGNAQAANRILELRHNRGNYHYLDSFFQSRIELLNKNYKQAKEYFKSSLIEAKKYNALGRLDFEIRMSCEIPLGKLLELFEQSTEVIKSQSSKNKIKSHEHELKGLDRIIGESNQMRTIKETVQNFSKLDIPVIITGETGTGKEVIAQALHELSDRHNKPFVAVNCGAIADSLLESDLYGHHKGAFTGATHTHKGYFETASDGTLFLDEIGTITPRLQISLLRVLETGEFRPIGDEKTRRAKCRILFATNADLEKDVEQGRFRKDLYFRLRRLELNLLPLRDRPSDIIPLADHFLNIGRNPEEHAYMNSKLQNILLNYSWPGNIRELQNSIENMRLLNSDKLTYLEDDIDLKIATSKDVVEPMQKSVLQESLVQPPMLSNNIVFGNTMIRKEQSIKVLFEKHTILTRAEISKALGLTPKTVTSYLKKLCEEKFIQKIMPSKSPKSHYFQKT
ncbi:MAG: hypothetical protein COA79_00950 [Planctomycetota bacterium]|nr:MAG: hypothetical protein COA79_00950 [Planctomycetota bacterium]